MNSPSKTPQEWLAEAQAADNELDAHAAAIGAVATGVDMLVPVVKGMLETMQALLERVAALEARVKAPGDVWIGVQNVRRSTRERVAMTPEEKESIREAVLHACACLSPGFDSVTHTYKGQLISHCTGADEGQGCCLDVPQLIEALTDEILLGLEEKEPTPLNTQSPAERELEHAHTCPGPPEHVVYCQAMFCQDRGAKKCWEHKLRDPNER